MSGVFWRSFTQKYLKIDYFWEKGHFFQILQRAASDNRTLISIGLFLDFKRMEDWRWTKTLNGPSSFKYKQSLLFTIRNCNKLDIVLKTLKTILLGHFQHIFLGLNCIVAVLFSWQSHIICRSSSHSSLIRSYSLNYIIDHT